MTEENPNGWTDAEIESMRKTGPFKLIIVPCTVLIFLSVLTLGLTLT